MKRKASLFIVLLFMMTLATHAVQPKLINTRLFLSFEGTTANCSAVVTSAGDKIDIDLELWHNDTLIKSWPASGNSSVTVEGSCRVTKGQTYKLLVTGIIGGKSYTSPAVFETC